MDRGVKCNVILQKCLAIRLQKNGGLPGRRQGVSEVQDYWMYDNGYLLFQGFLEANCKCFWNASLVEAMHQLQFEGYVAQSTLLVRGSSCALEVIRNAWARNVLNAPTNYSIVFVGDIEDCLITLVNQGQFTPLPEALCWVILELTSSGQNAVLDSIRTCLHNSFPGMERPSAQLVYDTLAKLMVDKKIYQTAQGYFIVTPESRRLRAQRANGSSSPHTKRGHRRSYSDIRDDGRSTKSLLMTTEEALTYVHGEMSTIRDGDVTHQSIQTNLADVICGGNPQDRILYPSVPKRSTTFPLERRNSLKIFGSGKKFSNGNLVRSGSMKYISNSQRSANSNLTDSSSSTDTASQLYQPISTKKATSLLARLFGRSSRKRGLSAPPTIHSFSAQFPPTEWFNPKVIHLHCVGTQTNVQDLRLDYGEYESSGSCRSYSLHHRHSKSPRLGRNSPKPKAEKTLSPSLSRLKPETPPPERTSYRNMNIDRIRRHSISKSSKSLNESRIYEEIQINTNDIYTKIKTAEKSPKINRRSASLPRRKISRNEPVTHTDFPYKPEEVPILPTKRSSSFEDLKQEEKGNQEMTSLTSSGYDTQTNSIISTHDQVPYSLKVNKNYLASSTPPSSLTIEDTYVSPKDFNESHKNTEVEVIIRNRSTPTKLERVPSLYSPREVLKTGYGFEQIHFTPVVSEESDLDKLCDLFPNRLDLKAGSRIPVKTQFKRPVSTEEVQLIKQELPDFPSLSDLTVNFKSLTAQNILNNVSLTSVDTLVEVNMAALANKEEQPFVKVTTDFGLV